MSDTPNDSTEPDSSAVAKALRSRSHQSQCEQLRVKIARLKAQIETTEMQLDTSMEELRVLSKPPIAGRHEGNPSPVPINAEAMDPESSTLLTSNDLGGTDITSSPTKVSLDTNDKHNKDTQTTKVTSTDLPSATPLLPELNRPILTDDELILKRARVITKNYIDQLSRYNEIKDVAHGLVSMIAEREGRTFADIMRSRGWADRNCDRDEV